MAEFTDKVVMLEQDMLSKSECISALSGHVDDLKAKNGNCARELRMLSVSVNKLVNASHQNNSLSCRVLKILYRFQPAKPNKGNLPLDEPKPLSNWGSSLCLTIRNIRMSGVD